jgi:hypothetical protein
MCETFEFKGCYFFEFDLAIVCPYNSSHVLWTGRDCNQVSIPYVVYTIRTGQLKHSTSAFAKGSSQRAAHKGNANDGSTNRYCEISFEKRIEKGSKSEAIFFVQMETIAKCMSTACPRGPSTDS